jgi:hypothetical protein
MLFLLAVAPITLPALTESPDGDVEPASIKTPSCAMDDRPLTDVLTVPSAVPRGPKEVVQDYEAEMSEVTQRFSASLAAVAQAVQSGRLSSEDGQKIAADQYQMAQMQFELLSTWRDMVAQDLSAYANAQSKAASKQGNDIVTVALPFSSLELNASLAEYLNLNQQQVQRIQQLMSEERRNLQPLMAQLQTVRQKLAVATGANERSEKEIKALATTEACLLSKLIVANSHMQARLYKLLTPEQQKKLDDFKRNTEVAMVAGD